MLLPVLAGGIEDFPIPPAEIAARPTNSTGQTIMNALIGLGVLGAYLAALRFRRRHGTWVPLAVTLGATFSALIEPLPDAVANLWYYAPGQQVFYASYGNSMPTWTFFSYTAYYGGIGMLFWWLVERGASRRRLAMICVPVAVYLAIGEIVMINVLRLYTYHGPAALQVAHYPMWICLMNTAIVVSIGITAARIRRSMPRRDQLLPAFLLPSVCTAIGLLVVPMVLWTVIHSENPPMPLVWAATAVTIAMAIAVIHSTMRLMPAEGFVPMAARTAATSTERLESI